MEEFEQMLYTIESLGWYYKVVTEPSNCNGGWHCKERNYVKLSIVSPAGENFIMSIDFAKENPVDTFLINLKKYWDSFDVDDHTAKWIFQRGQHGCPNSILELLVDAEQIKDSILKLWSALSGDVPFGTLGTRLSALLKEVSELVDLTPLPTEYSVKEMQVFSDLACLQKSLVNAGVAVGF